MGQQRRREKAFIWIKSTEKIDYALLHSNVTRLAIPLIALLKKEPSSPVKEAIIILHLILKPYH